MGEHHVRTDRGTTVMVVCSCGWRELCFTEREIQERVHAHKMLYGDTAGASDFVKKRRRRAQ